MTIETLLANFEFQEAPSGPEAEQLLQKIDFQVDGDWLSFALRHNGAYGEIGTYYVAFWTIDEICALNPYYAPENDDRYSSSLFFFASNGGDAGFAIRKADGVFLEVPYIGMSPEESIEMGADFLAFLRYLSEH